MSPDVAEVLIPVQLFVLGLLSFSESKLCPIVAREVGLVRTGDAAPIEAMNVEYSFTLRQEPKVKITLHCLNVRGIVANNSAMKSVCA